VLENFSVCEIVTGKCTDPNYANNCEKSIKFVESAKRGDSSEESSTS